MTALTTLEKFKKGDVSALARIISHVENREPGYREALSRLYRFERKAVRIGLTGPPGAGKSTLVDCLSRRLYERKQSVAVIAVDPSSPFTGGALLGDRVRSHELERKEGAPKHFFRSMATRGSRGGLSGATDNVALTMDAFGFDYILIETVGVGQVELDIVDNCDLVVVILVPESGDAVQTLKAGLTEIADIFVVNKADRDGADRIVADLEVMLGLREKKDDETRVPIVATDALREKNVDELLSEIDGLIEQKRASAKFEEDRERQMHGKISRILQNRFLSEASQRFADSGWIEGRISEILAGQDDPYSVADRLYEEALGG